MIAAPHIVAVDLSTRSPASIALAEQIAGRALDLAVRPHATATVSYDGATYEIPLDTDEGHDYFAWHLTPDLVLPEALGWALDDGALLTALAAACDKARDGDGAWAAREIGRAA